jgi:hypothetical protein
MPWQIRRRARHRGRGDVSVVGCVEAGDVGLVEARGRDEDDVGAGVEGLVLGAVEIGRVLDLERRDGAGLDLGG